MLLAGLGLAEFAEANLEQIQPPHGIRVGAVGRRQPGQQIVMGLDRPGHRLDMPGDIGQGPGQLVDPGFDPGKNEGDARVRPCRLRMIPAVAGNLVGSIGVGSVGAGITRLAGSARCAGLLAPGGALPANRPGRRCARRLQIDVKTAGVILETAGRATVIPLAQGAGGDPEFRRGLGNRQSRACHGLSPRSLRPPGSWIKGRQTPDRT